MKINNSTTRNNHSTYSKIDKGSTRQEVNKVVNQITLKATSRCTTKKITNWSEYNQALIGRGNVSIYVSEAIAKKAFLKPKLDRTKYPQGGHPREYSDSLILLILTIRELFRLPLRQTSGFVANLLDVMGLSWQLPDYSTLSRRMSKLDVDFCQKFRGKNVMLLIDSSGFKVFGEGEWKVRKYGFGYRRTWRETHIAIDAKTRNIIGLISTKSGVHDNTQLEPLLKQIQARHQAKTIIGDGAYDAKGSYLLARKLKLELVVPPPKNATEHLNQYHYHRYDTPGWEERNAVVRRVEEVGIDKWKQETGYHQRSLVENCYSRLKTIFGGNLKSRLEQTQDTEQCLRASLINQFNAMGLPQYT
jgi:hypothetical protein